MAKIYLHAIVRELSGRSEITCEIDGPKPIGEVLRKSLSDREHFLIIDETGALRRHLNVYVDTAKIKSLDSLIGANSVIDIFPAVSGG